VEQMKWLMRDHAAVLLHERTLNTSLQALICSITRLTAVQRLEASVLSCVTAAFVALLAGLKSKAQGVSTDHGGEGGRRRGIMVGSLRLRIGGKSSIKGCMG
jgi:hypothetical protein